MSPGSDFIVNPPERLLPQRHGSAKRPGRAVAHARTANVSDETVDALGALSAALETVEHARGHLYAFHRLSGSSDLALGEAVDKLRQAGHEQLADEIEQTLVGRDVIDGHWTFELVESYDEGYWSVFRDVEREARRRLGFVEPHVFEAEMKTREQSAVTGGGSDC